MPHYSLRRGPSPAELADRVGPSSITPSGRAKFLQRFQVEQWLVVKEQLTNWIKSGEIVPYDEARVLEMEKALRVKIEQQLGWLFGELSRKEVSLLVPQQAISSAQRRQLWHWDAIGLRRLKRSQVGTGRGVTIGMLDTGIDGTHPELGGRALRSAAVKETGGIKRLRKLQDPHGHGTYVAGLLVGKTIGIAPDAKLLCVQVLSPEGTGNEWTILAGLTWLMTQADVKVIVLALSYAGSRESQRVWQSAIEKLLDLDILPVIAAGNDGPGGLSIPGNTQGGLSVGAATRKKLVASFSSSNAQPIGKATRAPTVPTLIAPGESIYSILPDGQYNTWTGTTPATAVVAGLAALVRERHPRLSARDIRERIVQHCRPVKAPEYRQGAGMVRVEAAL